METFTEPKALVANPDYRHQRQKCLGELRDGMIDRPIAEVVNAFNKLPYCFTMQSCYGHFVFSGRSDPQNLEPLPPTETISRVEYRIAYIAFCIENSALGRMFYEAVRKMEALDPNNIQFGCAEWFWRRQVNSYALQVEPERFKYEDKAVLDYREALGIEKTRDKFFFLLRGLLEKQLKGNKPLR